MTPFALGMFSVADRPAFAAVVVEDRVLAVDGAAGGMIELLAQWPRALPRLQAIADEAADRGIPVDSLICHPPVGLPRQIFCSGANYKKHVVDIIVAQAREETRDMSLEERRVYGTRKMDDRAANGTPFFFLKAQSTVTGPFDPIILPADVRQPDWELELGVVIGRPARRVARADALRYVAGYTIVNDITTRERVNRRDGDMKEMGMDWVASKCAPTFLPMGPYLVPAQFVPDPQDLRITLKLNGQVMQDESTADMIFDVARLIESLSALCLLQPGDVLCTGSPAGNGMHYGRFLRPGDVLEGRISGLGTQRNRCVAEQLTAALEEFP